tara:strand:- start:846 stop:1214 length:369 start_codon:yes stop_codon:yes gene_type:complete
MEIDKKIIKRLIEVLEDLKKSLSKTGEQLNVPDPEVNIENVENENYKSVKSPIIGTAYLAPEPGAKPFVEIGKKIKRGDTVMIVEAMKTMNHVPSTCEGIVKKVSVEDGQPVEYDQVLILVE